MRKREGQDLLAKRGLCVGTESYSLPSCVNPSYHWRQSVPRKSLGCDTSCGVLTIGVALSPTIHSVKWCSATNFKLWAKGNISATDKLSHMVLVSCQVADAFVVKLFNRESVSSMYVW